MRISKSVSVAKLKTHHWSGVTLSLKNLFGVIPGCRYGWPKNILHWNSIDRSILEIFGTVRPGFAVIDGITGMEGDGPLNGTAREVGLIAAGNDMVALDATAAPRHGGLLSGAHQLSAVICRREDLHGMGRLVRCRSLPRC